jgi:hypothetical protein
MVTTINKTIGIGDAGLPLDVSIDVTYEKQSNLITVIYWMEEQSPYDNPPELWFARMKEIISEYFFEQSEDNQVVYK